MGQQAASALTWRLLGFRHVALVTINDTDTTAAVAAKNQDGTANCNLNAIFSFSAAVFGPQFGG